MQAGRITPELRKQFEIDGIERVRYLAGTNRYNTMVMDAAFEWLQETEQGELLGGLAPERSISPEARTNFEKLGAARVRYLVMSGVPNNAFMMDAAVWLAAKDYAEKKARAEQTAEQERLAISSKRAGWIGAYAAIAAALLAAIGIAATVYAH